MYVLWAPDFESPHYGLRSVRVVTYHSSATWPVVHLHPAWSVIVVSQSRRIILFPICCMICFIWDKEYHKSPARVRISITQEVQRSRWTPWCYQIIKDDDLWHCKGGEPCSIWLMLPARHHIDVLISRGITIKLTSCNLAPVKNSLSSFSVSVIFITRDFKWMCYIHCRPKF